MGINLNEIPVKMSVILSRPQCVNPSYLSDVHLCRKIGSLSACIMVHHLFDTKPLSKVNENPVDSKKR